MRKSLAKSIYLGAAALAFAGIAGATSASAKSYAKVTSIGSFKGNVVATGSNAVTTKAATLQGAKTVKSASALKTAQDADKTGNYNFRAYSVATTNRGSVYYKVVSFDKTVRGWVYGGKVKGTVAGGIKDFATTTDATAPTGDQTAKDGAQLWNAPAWTTYKVGRASEKLANGAKFTVSKAVTNSKSGDIYYQIAGTKTAADGKWIAAKDVTAPVANTVTVNFVEKTTGKTVGSTSVPFKATTVNSKGELAMDVADAKDANGNYLAQSAIPTGYGPLQGLPQGASTWGDDVASKAATAGSSLVYYVQAYAKTKQINVKLANKAYPTDSTWDLYQYLTKDQSDKLIASTKKDQFQISNFVGSEVKADSVKAVIADAGLTSFNFTKDGKVYTATLDTTAGTTVSDVTKDPAPYAYFNVALAK
ncbi:hypothetical protein [Secundilactobacillus kimchicus]|uniref:hypothetical protein n=1 Tax=Secundilactobacillus kimchicus TaxID=528209 RepID=UPI0024A88813|nr:hypothetical protein [Secundilactobacillus kimchicus]